MKKTVLLLTIFLVYTGINASAKGLSVLRLDKDLFEYITSPNKEKEKVLLQKYPTLLPALAQTVIGNNEEVLLPELESYFSHPSLKTIYKDAIDKYADISNIESSLNRMIENSKVHLQTTKQPRFAMHVSGFKENTIYVNQVISLSIDKYMGTDYGNYKSFFNNQQRQQMKPEYIVRDFTKAWLMADFIKTESTDGDLLGELIEHGKLLYALKILLPDYTEYDLLGYTAQENDWCENNQKKVWDFIIKNDLYTKDKQLISSLFSQDSGLLKSLNNAPANIGSWIGFQIVKKYADETKSSLKDILATNERTLLKKSKYKPSN